MRRLACPIHCLCAREAFLASDAVDCQRRPFPHGRLALPCANESSTLAEPATIDCDQVDLDSTVVLGTGGTTICGRLGQIENVSLITGDTGALGMIKTDIVRTLELKTGLLHDEATLHVEHILTMIKDSLEDGESVLISGFGQWKIR